MGCSCSIAQTEETKPITPINIQMFIINGLIGEGGFGKVMTALFVKNNNWYAVKEIKKNEITKHKTGLAMILGEISALKRLDHPFVVSLHFAFQDRHHCYLILDLKTGGDLRYYLKKKLLFEERDVAFYVACVSSALDHIHSRNIIHRDIKPENIILDERGYPHLADFGVAHVQTSSINLSPNSSSEWDEEETLTSNLASGTKQYLAPEVFTKTHVHGPESDYWSLGVVAYELLFGKRPFDKHCPIPYITYLEKGLSSKRSKQKEQTRLRSISSSKSGWVPGSPGTATGGDSCSSGSNSPCRAASGSFDFSGSITPLSPSQLSMRLNGLSVNTQDSRKLPGMFPTIHTGSTDGASHSDGNSYCSSVGYTAAQTVSSSVVHASKRSFSGGIAGRDSDLSITCGLSSEHNTREGHERPRGSSSCDEFEHNKLAHIAGNNKIFSKSCSGRSTPNGLPNLVGIASPKRCTTPPRAMYKIPEASVSAYIPFGDHKTRGGVGTMDRDSAEPEEVLIHTHLRRAPPGDHWAVDEGELPASLIISVPTSNPWLGDISDNCITLLEGLFEVRPSHRLGARNIAALKNHPWLVQHQVSDWTELQTKTFSPHFRPGKKFIKETMEEQSTNLVHKYIDSDGGGDSAIPALTAEQDLLFRDFKYSAPAYCDMFPDEYTANRELVCKDKHSMEFSKHNSTLGKGGAPAHSAKQRGSGSVKC